MREREEGREGKEERKEGIGEGRGRQLTFIVYLPHTKHTLELYIVIEVLIMLPLPKHLLDYNVYKVMIRHCDILSPEGKIY